MRIRPLPLLLAAGSLLGAVSAAGAAPQAATLLQTGAMIAVTSSGNVFVGNPGAVVTVSPQGTVLARWKNYHLAKGLSSMPPEFLSMAAAPDGSLWACDVTDNLVIHVSTAGNTVRSWKENNCDALAVDSHGTVYMTGTGNGAPQETVWAFSPDGKSLWHRPTPVNDAIRMAVAPSGDLYFTGKLHGKWVVYGTDPAGKLLTAWNTQVNRPEQFVWPMGVATDRANNVYVVDQKTSTLVKFAPASRILATINLTGRLRKSSEVGVDANGDIYVAGFKDLAKLSPTGKVIWEAP